MADPLSIAASVAGVVSAGFTVAKGLYQIASGIGSAGEEVRMYGDEVAGIAKLLYQIRSEILGTDGGSTETRRLLNDTIQLCDQVLVPLQRMLDTLKPLLARFSDTDNRLRQFGLRIQWSFRTKDKLLFYRRALNAQHKLLQTLLSLLSLQVTRDRSAANLNILSMSLEHSILTTVTTVYGRQVAGHLTSQQQNLAANRPSQRLLLLENDTASVIPEMDGEHGQDGPILPNLHSLDATKSGSQPGLLLRTDADGDEEFEDSSELKDVDDGIENALDPGRRTTMVGVMEDMRLTSKGVLTYAWEELKQSSPTLEFGRPIGNSTFTQIPLPGSQLARYRSVQVLLIHWKSDDLFVLPELEDLEKVFREDYGYETDVFEIPSENSHLELLLKVADLIKRCESSDNLFVVYYGGHARIDEARQSTWCATRKPDSPWLSWSAIQALFSRTASDVLILLDCSAGIASAQFANGNNLVEIISASSWDAIAPDPGRYSFTNVVIEVLQEWREKRFSAAMLHAETLVRLKHPRPITINGKQFEARSTPVHFMASLNFRAPSIELVSLLLPTTQGRVNKHEDDEKEHIVQDPQPFVMLRGR